MVVCLHIFQEKERALGCARQYEVKYNGSTLRFYSNISADLAKKCAAFKNAKQLLYQKRIHFQLLHPVWLQVRYEDETFLVNTPDEAQQFYDRQVATCE